MLDIYRLILLWIMPYFQEQAASNGDQTSENSLDERDEETEIDKI